MKHLLRPSLVSLTFYALTASYCVLVASQNAAGTGFNVWSDLTPSHLYPPSLLFVPNAVIPLANDSGFLVFGGTGDGLVYSNELWWFSTQHSSWFAVVPPSPSSPWPQPRSWCVLGFPSPGRAVVFGGPTLSLSVGADVWLLDFHDDSTAHWHGPIVQSCHNAT